MQKLGLSWVIFIFVYNLTFFGFPISTGKLVALAGGLAIALLTFAGKRIVVTRDILTGLGLLLFYTMWVGIRSLFAGFEEISLLINGILLIFEIGLGALAIALAMRALGFDLRQCVDTIHLAITYQGFLIILTFISPSMRDLAASVLPHLGNEGLESIQYRSRGFTNGTGATLAATQAIGLLACFYAIITAPSTKTLLEWARFASAGILLLSILLTGRTGFLILPVIFCLLIYITIVTNRIPRALPRTLAITPIAILSAYIGLVLGYKHILGGWTTPWGEDGMSQLARWIISEFYQNGQVRSHTASVLIKDHLHFPSDSLHFLIGDPATWSQRRIQSDMGVVRRTYATGAIGLMLIYSFFLFTLFAAIKRASAKETGLMVLLFSFAFVLELKEPMLTSFRITSLCFIPSVFLMLPPVSHAASRANRPR